MARDAFRTEESWATSPGVRRCMQSNRPRDTQLEVAVRSVLHRAGLRFRKHVRPVPEIACTPDVVFTRARLAVFVDGCYWHGCRRHRTYPRAHGDWWRQKLDGNKARDRRNNRALRAAGWKVLRVWEHEPAPKVVSKVLAVLEQSGPQKRATSQAQELTSKTSVP
jgi:DNA mismatch endonuclease (patch repair protein)